MPEIINLQKPKTYLAQGSGMRLKRSTIWAPVGGAMWQFWRIPEQSAHIASQEAGERGQEDKGQEASVPFKNTPRPMT